MERDAHSGARTGRRQDRLRRCGCCSVPSCSCCSSPARTWRACWSRDRRDVEGLRRPRRIGASAFARSLRRSLVESACSRRRRQRRRRARLVGDERAPRIVPAIRATSRSNWAWTGSVLEFAAAVTRPSAGRRSASCRRGVPCGRTSLPCCRKAAAARGRQPPQPPRGRTRSSPARWRWRSSCSSPPDCSRRVSARLVLRRSGFPHVLVWTAVHVALPAVALRPERLEARVLRSPRCAVRRDARRAISGGDSVLPMSPLGQVFRSVVYDRRPRDDLAIGATLAQTPRASSPAISRRWAIALRRGAPVRQLRWPRERPAGGDRQRDRVAGYFQNGSPI